MPTDDMPEDALGRGNAEAQEGKRSSRGLEALKHALDEAVAATPALPDDPLLEAELERWLTQFDSRANLRRVPLSTKALEFAAELAPDGSLTEKCIARLDAARKAARRMIDEERHAETQCKATSPGELFRSLRARAGVDPEPAASALGITPRTLLAIETRHHPWHAISPEALPQFAKLVREPVGNIVVLIRLTAKRFLTAEIYQRAQLALGRFDENSDAMTAQRERLQLAFARMRQENQAAAAFLHAADQLKSAQESTRTDA